MAGRENRVALQRQHPRLLSAAASLAGCTAGYGQDTPPRSVRITPRGEAAPQPLDAPAPRTLSEVAPGITVWLERDGAPHANDAIILERLSLAVRMRHGRGRSDADGRRDLGLVLDRAVPTEERRVAAARIGLLPGVRYRTVAAPLFAAWGSHPPGPEDVIATSYGPIHASIVACDRTVVDATPSGIGTADEIDGLHRSFRAAVVALRLCAPPATPTVLADDFGGLIGLLADLPHDSDQPDVESVDLVMRHPWGPTTLDALVRAGSVRQAARLAGVHHSTLQARIDGLTADLGYNPLDDGMGRTRLGLAYLVWRLRNSRVLDLPAPTTR